jgi:hypothetical protein
MCVPVVVGEAVWKVDWGVLYVIAVSALTSGIVQLVA